MPFTLVSIFLIGITKYNFYSSVKSCRWCENLAKYIRNYNFYSSVKLDKIPENYIAIFNGGSGEITYSTYIYKINNGQANYGFQYINTTNTTTSWGSSDWNIKITSKGTVNWIQDIFHIAEENNAYSYVKLPNDSKIYTIDEYRTIFSLK